MLLDDDWVVTIKGETHNFPSSIAPFGGIATKHGGVIRDSIGFGKGGFAIGGSTIMGTMDPRLPAEDVPAGALHPGYLVRESIRATAYYCNPMGIPMMYPVYRAHPGYPKCFALGHSIGLIPRRHALKDVPRPGDIVLLFGGRTGRDGLHGATASSAQMTGETLQKEAAAVQIGHPITERKFMEAVPVLRDAGCIRAITDLGAGGISCAVGEMGEPTGVQINLDVVPLKDASLAPWEILLSESQERMLAAVPVEKLGQAQDILSRYDVEFTILGEFTGSGRYEVFYRGEKVVDLEMAFLWEGCPIDAAQVRAPASFMAMKDETPVAPDVPDIGELPDFARRVLGHYHCCDQSPAGTQFDSTIQGRTVIGPYGGRTGKMPTGAYVSAPVRGKTVGVASTVAFNPFYGELSPAGLARLMMLEAVAKAVAVGADPAHLALCDNFYTPKSDPEVNWALSEMVNTIADLSVRLGMPFISGKDSSSGTFRSADGQIVNVPLTLVIATLARVPDVTRVVRKELRAAGDRLVLLGELHPDRLGGSVYLDCRGTRGDVLHDPGQEGAAAYRENWERLFAVYRRPENPVRAAAAIGEGGLFVRLFEMAYGGGFGLRLDLDTFGAARWDGVLFAEAMGSILLEVAADTDPATLFTGVPWREIGRVIEEPQIQIVRRGEIVAALDITDMVQAWEATFAEVTI
jgi:phosphoribosylformylglycinamidine synthase